MLMETNQTRKGDVKFWSQAKISLGGQGRIKKENAVRERPLVPAGGSVLLP